MNYRERKNRHLNELKKQTHPNRILQSTFNKHNEDIFNFQIIEIIENKNDLITREQYYINEYKALDRKYGYNLCAIANSALGIKRSNEWKRKMSLVHKGKKNTPESIKKMSDSHKLMSNETRKKISESKKGIKMPESTKSAIIKSVTGNKWMIGKKHSAETIQKIRNYGKAKKLKIFKCPHCNVDGNFSIFRNHFDNCKLIKS